MFKYKSITTVFLLLLFFSAHSQTNVDLSLISTSTNVVVEVGTDGRMIFTLGNQGQTKATNVKVHVNSPYFPPFVKFVSAAGSKGIFDIGSGLWSIPEINGQETVTLTVTYIPMEYGVWYAEAEVYSVNEHDLDSTPNNKIDSEDDFTRACFSMPIKVSSTSFGRQIILEDSKISNIVWRKDGQIIQNQTSSVLPVTSVGSYSFNSPTFICPAQGCCPFIFEQGAQTLCCEPFEVGLKAVGGGNGGSPMSLEITGNNENAEDSDVSSIAPDANYANSEFMDPYAWTQNGIINIKRNYLKFNLSSIPLNATIDSARLSIYFGEKLVQVYTAFSGHTGENQLVIQRVLQDWSENTINWNNKPSTTTQNALHIPKASNNLQNYLNLNVTNLVSDMIKNGNFGFMIKHEIEEPYKITVFSTSESLNPALRPHLKVYYH